MWRLQVWGFRVITILVSCIPLGLAMRFGEGVGLLMHFFLARRRRVAEENIRLCIEYMRNQPEWGGGEATVQELVRAVFINLGRTLVETCRLYQGLGAAIIDNIEFRGSEHFEQALSHGRGMIFITAHCGNWELLALGYGQHFDSPISVLARRQDNPYLNRMVEYMRVRYNNRVIYKSGALRGIISAARRNETIGILVDQSVMPEEGCLVKFMGRKAWASKLPVILAQKTGVPVVPAFLHREDGHHVMSFFPEIVFEGDKSDEGVVRDTQRYITILEKFIIGHPTEWYWVHKRWKRTEGQLP